MSHDDLKKRRDMEKALNDAIKDSIHKSLAQDSSFLSQASPAELMRFKKFYDEL